MSHYKVCKFGGSSLANAEQIRKVGDIIQKETARKFIVVSAPGKDSNQKNKITDLLYNLYFKSFPDISDRGIKYQRIDLTKDEILENISAVYSNISNGLNLGGKVFLDCMSELEDLVSGRLNQSYETIVSRGENFNARLIADFLKADFVDSLSLIHVDGSPDNDITMSHVKHLLNRDNRVVIPGFYGSLDKHMHKNSKIGLLPRGGSDLTGSLIAAGVGAKLYENWTDTNGICFCDPRYFEKEERAHIPIIKNMSYREARELTYMGFDVFNDESVQPLKLRGIPVNIRNTNNYSAAGTIISAGSTDDNFPIRGIAAKEGFCSINISKYLMNKQIGFGRDLLNILYDFNIGYEHFPGGVDDVSLVLEQKQLEGIEEELVKKINYALSPDSVKIMKNIGLIAIVGEKMKHHVGIATKVMTALSDNNINVDIINQGASESNIILGVNSSDLRKSVVALYNGFKDDLI